MSNDQIDAIESVKLYRFRSLTDCSSVERVEETIRTGLFWCSRFWEMNDPMEGIFRADISPTIANEVLSEKSSRLICCFSREAALLNPLMWGYYAGGFKGLAIEVTINGEESEIHEVHYQPDVTMPGAMSGRPTVTEILTRKLIAWKDEEETRFVTASNERKQKIGQITGLYFGLPYANASNFKQISMNHPELRDYVHRSRRILDVIPAGVQTYRMEWSGSLLGAVRTSKEDLFPTLHEL